MRYLILLLLPIFQLLAIQIELREGKENGETYSTLHLISEEPVYCKKKLDEFEEIYEIECQFSSRYGNKLKSFSNSYFDVQVERDSRTTTIKIQPRYNSVVFSSDYDIPTIQYFYPRKEKEFAKHWLVIGFKGTKIPYINSKYSYNPNRISFPVELKYKNTPFVGPLDVDGHPIKEEKSKDVSEYLNLKSEFAKGNYRDVLKMVHQILNKYPDTLFRPEIIIYQIRALFKLKEYQKIINIAKGFLRDYSSHEGVPEVLLYTAYVHSKLGFLAYAKYYFQRLFEEHKDSEFSNLGYVYYGDDRIYQGKRAEAIRYYKKALYSTKDKMIATKAAYRLGNVYLKSLKPDEAEFYLRKVVEGNPDYFNRKPEANYKLAKDLADFNKTIIASDIMKIILKGKSFDVLDDYENMLKDLAVWLDMSGRVEEAYQEYTRYLNTYAYGMYDKLIRTNRDKLLFKRGEKNVTKLFENYNKLIEEYGLDSEVGQQAIYEKAKLLHDTGEYSMVLELENDLEFAKKAFPDVENVIRDSAIKDAEIKLNNGDCGTAIAHIFKYNIELPHRNDMKLYRCAMKSGKYQLAEKLAKRNLEESNQLLDWEYNYAQVLIKTSRYKKFLEVSDEVISLMESEGTDKYLNIYYDRFKAFDILEDNENILKTVQLLDKYFNGTYRNLQPFKRIVSIAKERKDYFMIEKYARKIMEIQRRLNSYVETPEIEILLITALKHQNKLEDVIDVANELLKRDIDSGAKARAYYELGTAYQSLGMDDKAKESFKKSYEADPNNSWGKLSKDYLEFF